MNKTTTTTRTFTTRKQQRGASLLEGIAYLGIAAIVILGAVSLLTTAFGSAQSNRASEEVISLRTASKKLFAGQAYPADMSTALVAASAVPGTMVVDQNTKAITNSWGGTVTVVGSAGANGSNTFTITTDAVPQDACITMLSGAAGWTQVAVGSTAITAFPVTAADATNACNGSKNAVSFTAV